MARGVGGRLAPARSHQRVGGRRTSRARRARARVRRRHTAEGRVPRRPEPLARRRGGAHAGRVEHESPQIAAGSVGHMAPPTPEVPVAITVNGVATEHVVESRTLLVQYLRDVIGLTGTNIGCDSTSCGACTVLLDGESVKSCTVLAAQADGRAVTTIEGLADGDELHPMQIAFREHHGLQCGYCTPGMVMAAVGLATERGALSSDEVRQGLEGNLCRCTGYHNIVKSVIAGAEAMNTGAHA